MSFMDENMVQFYPFGQTIRRFYLRNSCKNFDFLVYPHTDASPLVVELKGRLFKAVSLTKNSAFQNWVTSDDISSLLAWQKYFRSLYPASHSDAAFVFAYKFTNIDVETDGKETYHFNGSE